MVARPAGASEAKDEAVDFERFFDAAPCGFIVTDANLRIVRANSTVSTWLGREPAGLSGLHFADLLTVGGKLYLETHLSPLVRMTGAFSEVALDLSGPGAARIPVLVSAIEHREDEERATSISIVLFSAMERRQYERNILEAQHLAEGAAHEVQERAELREQLMAILGHDLRNPLAAISSGLTILKRESLSDRAQRVVGLMEASMVRASVLIDNVLDFARARLGGGIALVRDANKPLAPVIEHVVAELRLIAPDRTIITEIDLPDSLPVDQGRMGQLVSNLLSNALTHGARAEPVRISARVAEGELQISVANGGAPIPEETMANLFRPFVRGTTRQDRPGLGLGLHIALQIAKAHGGSLSVTSSQEVTKFSFRMPFTE